MRGKFAQIKRGQGAQRHSDQQTDGGDDQGGGDQRRDAVARLGKERRPLGVGEEVPDRDLAEKAHRLDHQNGDHRHRDGNGRQGR